MLMWEKTGKKDTEREKERGERERCEPRGKKIGTEERYKDA